MTREEMHRLIDETIDTQLEKDLFYDDTSTRGVPGPPTNENELKALEEHLGRKGLAFPPSYRRFLSICNGIEGFRFLESFNLHSASMVIEESKCEKEWSHFKPVNRFMIGGGDTTVIVGFDPDSANQYGEMKIVEFSAEGDRLEHDDFELLSSRPYTENHAKRHIIPG